MERVVVRYWSYKTVGVIKRTKILIDGSDEFKIFISMTTKVTHGGILLVLGVEPLDPIS